jgi:[lysine-biosynthesis-protein LysW]---L-2-aminoadipate ligase
MEDKMRIGLLYTTLREEDELIIGEAQKQDVDLHIIDAQALIFSTTKTPPDCDIYLDRCTHSTLSQHTVTYLECMNKVVIDSRKVTSISGNKFYTSLVLEKHALPVVPYALAFTIEQALTAVELLGGFPVVMKPVEGLKGRLVARINDRESLEALVEHKLAHPGMHNHPLYLQPFIKKPGRDIRVTVVGGQVLCAIYRVSEHWVTNTSRGARALPCPIDRDLQEISAGAAGALGGGVLGIDIFEGPDGSYLINEVNHNPEFKNMQRVTGVNIAREIVLHAMEKGKP